MDEPTGSLIPPIALYAAIGTDRVPLILDVRPAPEFDSDRTMIVGSLRRSPEALGGWIGLLPQDRDIVVCCSMGGADSETVAAALRERGLECHILQGGLAAWRAADLPLRLRHAGSHRWVTRERPKIDRIACPWLIRRFIDPEAEFLYVPSASVLETAAKREATPYDVPGVEFGHLGDRCSFDAFLRIYDIHDHALDRLALIIRGADTGRPELTPESPGLLAVSHGLSANFSNDHAMLEQGMHVYDALYAWCRLQRGATA